MNFLPKLGTLSFRLLSRPWVSNIRTPFLRKRHDIKRRYHRITLFDRRLSLSRLDRRGARPLPLSNHQKSLIWPT